MSNPQVTTPSFSELALNPSLVNALTDLGREQPTPVQSQTIPVVLDKKDILVSAQTGSGKTMAYLLPILHQFLDTPHENTQGTRALILVPTRELAQQAHKHCEELAQKTAIKSVAITGGHDFKYQSALLRKNPEIIIATPGRLQELIEKGKADLRTLETLVVDEADRLLDMGFSEDVLNIINFCNTDRQTLLFSATLQQKGLQSFFDHIVKNPEVISIASARSNHNDIKQQIILADNKEHKDKLLGWLVSNEDFKKALVFSNTRVQANQLGGLLRYQKIKAGVLHGDMKQTQRKQVISLFAQGAINVLIASDVAARGLDIKDVDLVINIDMPTNSNDYVHRIGRTGRAGEKGQAITLVGPTDWNAMISTQRFLNSSFERRAIDGLKSKYKGPKKVKNSGKAAGSKKKKIENTSKKPATKKTKKLKSRPSNKPLDGFAPLKKK